jgi:hypothetical protein
MKFNTTSYLAGVGSVVAVLSTGFAGGYFIANPTRVDPPNRLQRLAAEDHSAPAATAVKPEVVAAATPAAAALPAAPAAAPATATPPATSAVQPPVEAKTPEPVHTAATQETPASAADKPDSDKVNTQKASADKQRAAEAKVAERKRSETRKVADQQRKQRELDVATVAVRRIIHGRDASDVVVRDRDASDVVIHDRDAPEMVENDPPEAPGPAMPHFNLFGQ